MAKIVNDIKPRTTDSAYVEAPFDEGKKTLEDAGYRVISAEENARLRSQEGKEAFISRNGNWTREGFVYVPQEAHVYLTKHSPIMENPKEATQSQRERKEFCPTDEQIERAIDSSVSIRVPYTQKPIPTDRFADDGVAVFTFGQFAQAYGNFLRQAGINEMPVYLVDKCNVNKSKKPFARQLWLRNLDNRSYLVGNYSNLFYYNRVRGVPLQAAEGSEATQNK